MKKNGYNKMYNSIKNLNNIFKKKRINLQIGFVVTFILKKYYLELTLLFRENFYLKIKLL